MDSKQIGIAMRDELPVVYNGNRYEKITEYIMWFDREKKRRLSAVLLSGNHVVRVPADEVELAETEE